MENMKRRSFLTQSAQRTIGMAAGVSAFSAALNSCGGEEPAGSNNRPNFIIFLLDDAGWGDFGYHGSHIRTPTIDALAREGVEMDRFYTYPVCTPTRAAMMLGCPPSRFGLTSAVSSRFI